MDAFEPTDETEALFKEVLNSSKGLILNDKVRKRPDFDKNRDFLQRNGFVETVRDRDIGGDCLVRGVNYGQLAGFATLADWLKARKGRELKEQQALDAQIRASESSERAADATVMATKISERALGVSENNLALSNISLSTAARIGWITLAVLVVQIGVSVYEISQPQKFESTEIAAGLKVTQQRLHETQSHLERLVKVHESILDENRKLREELGKALNTKLEQQK